MPETASNTISPAATESYDLLRGECGIIPTEHLSVLVLTGEDRKGWLQGQATNDLRSFTPGTASAFCLCQATGQIVAICDVWAGADRFFLTTARECAEAVLQRAETMVILEDVVATDVTTTYQLISVQGPTASTVLGERLTLPTLDAGSTEVEGVEVWMLRSNRTGMGGWDVLIPADKTSLIAKIAQGIPKIHPSAAEAARIEAGVPRYGSDVTAKTLPAELGSAFEARHISYSKGCYMGQEVLMRMHSRGHTNKTWVGLMAEHPLEIGAVISHARRAEAGVVTSIAFSPDYGHIGAAIVRNEASGDGESVSVQTSRGPEEAEVRVMPILRIEY
jgi:tRNA-modifying protein YgfZ